MTVQEYIQENRYADSIPRRTAAVLGKFAVEGFIVGFFLLVVALFVTWLLDLIQFSPEGVPTGWQALWVGFVTPGFPLFWCYTSDEP
ncbi:hypothetical protein Hrd1104_00100 [Halorhabdus sp. CBA1104]|uniref:hypothetical protein n=1 Tax=Halorhabdus sp. CBA1104 TaxID=1380432 RepID=UPI0012B278B2|nr:hypothetical protein [Halorhabdus sp. CBA1104]QGN05846.1 hypothetical protein Hrd1104_00100 [Halorhabdus sp. CBA1104]